MYFTNSFRFFFFLILPSEQLSCFSLCPLQKSWLLLWAATLGLYGNFLFWCIWVISHILTVCFDLCLYAQLCFFTVTQASGRRQYRYITPLLCRTSVTWSGWLWPTAGQDSSLKASAVRSGIYTENTDCIWFSCHSEWIIFCVCCSLWASLGCSFQWEG